MKLVGDELAITNPLKVKPKKKLRYNKVLTKQRLVATSKTMSLNSILKLEFHLGVRFGH